MRKYPTSTMGSPLVPYFQSRMAFTLYWINQTERKDIHYWTTLRLLTIYSVCTPSECHHLNYTLLCIIIHISAVHMPLYISTHTQYTHVQTHTCMYTHTYTHTHAHTHGHTETRTHTRTHTVHTRVHAHIHIYKHTRTNTHTHVHTSKLQGMQLIYLSTVGPFKDKIRNICISMDYHCSKKHSQSKALLYIPTCILWNKL